MSAKDSMHSVVAPALSCNMVSSLYHNIAAHCTACMAQALAIDSARYTLRGTEYRSLAKTCVEIYTHSSMCSIVVTVLILHYVHHCVLHVFVCIYNNEQVSPQKTPMVIGKLLDLDCNEDFIRNLLNRYYFYTLHTYYDCTLHDTLRRL
jgi:hypothetical protein